MRALRLVQLTVVLIGTAVGGWLLFREVRTDFLADSVPDDFELTPLRISDSTAWRKEKWMTVVLQSGDGVEWRSNFDPEDGPRLRKLEEDHTYEEMPWPAGLEADAQLGLEGKARERFGAPGDLLPTVDRPAVVWCGSPDELLSGLRGIGPDRYYPIPRLYFGGRGRSGRVVALPFSVNAPRGMFGGQFSFLGVDLGTMREVHGPDRFLELRITRLEGRTRYRWGHYPDYRKSSRQRWDGGDRLVSEARLRVPGDGPLLPGMAETYRTEMPKGAPYRLVVRVQTGRSARVIDLIRAMECAQGDPKVLFFVERTHPAQFSPPPVDQVPTVETVVESCELHTGFDLVNVLPDGQVKYRAEDVTVETVPGPKAGITRRLVRSLHGAPWRVTAQLLTATHAHGINAALAFEAEELVPSTEWYLMLPVTPDGETAERIDAAPDATIDDVLPRLLKRSAAGVRYFRFD